MTWFTASTQSEAVINAARTDVWAALTDPVLLAKLTPFLRRIDVEGDHWRWDMGTVKILGASVSPTFTELMTFEEGATIDYRHDPPEGGTRERAGVDGWYHLEDAGEGRTRLAINLGVRVDLPLAKLAKPAVTTAMKGVLAGMGRKFSANLLDHLGAR